MWSTVFPKWPILSAWSCFILTQALLNLNLCCRDLQKWSSSKKTKKKNSVCYILESHGSKFQQNTVFKHADLYVMLCRSRALLCAFTVFQPTDRVYINSITELCSRVSCIKGRGVFSPPCLVESACAWILSTNLFCSLPAWLIVHKAVRDDSNQPQLSLSWRSRCKTCRRALKHYLVLLVLFLALPSPSLLTCLWPHPPHYAHSQVPAPFCFPHVQTLQSADTHSAQRLPSWDAVSESWAVAAVCSSVEWVLSCLYPFVAAVMKRGVDVKLVEQGCWTISQLS